MAPPTSHRDLAVAFADPLFLADPYPLLGHLHRDGRCHWDPQLQLYFFGRHDDVDTLLRDRRLGRAPLHAALTETGLAAFDRLNRYSLFDMEPPDHTRMRRLVQFAFTPARVRRLRPRIEQIASNLTAGLRQAGEFDLIADFAEPLPVAVIAEMLGIHLADRHKLRPWSRAIVRMFELQPSPSDQSAAEQAAVEFCDYLQTLIGERRRAPTDDLITALAFAEVDGQRLHDVEVIATVVLLLNAGHEATVNAIGNGFWALLRHPQALSLLRERPTLLPSATEELLRYDTPLQLFKRWVREDVAIAGVDLQPGDQVALLFGAANRDGAVFEDPERLDIRRSPNPHLGFGGGLHYCLGAPLARLELQIALAALLRLPQLVVVEQPCFQPTFVIRGLQALHLRIGE